VKNEPISRVMTPAPATVSPTSSVAAAERLMREKGCHHVPVVEDDGRVVGMVGARDLLKVLVLRAESDSEVLSQASLEARCVAEIMQPKVVALPQTATLLDAAKALAKGKVYALPVVAPNDALVGIVTSTDLIDTLVDVLKHPVSESAGESTSSDPTGSQARLLRDVYRATISYLESGRGELEHGRLLQAVNRAREAIARTDLQI
jgi:CBS domain-containing protein